jgi:O-antigen/teichoic acid export membrane protein
MNRSILKNYLANIFGLSVNFFNQLAMIPLYINFWGVDRYADWIIITSLSTFFSMSDLGLNRASNNEFVVQYAKKDYIRCKSLMANSLLFIFLTLIFFILLSFAISYFFGFKILLSVKSFGENQTTLAFMFLICQVFLTMLGRVYHGVFRAVNLTHKAILIDNIVKLCEIIVLLIGVIKHCDIVNILFFYNIPVVIGIFFKRYVSSKYFKYKFEYSNFDKNVLVGLMKPSIAFMLLPLGQAVASQGVVFLINIFLGSTLLVAFTTIRTLVNVIRQLMNMLSISVNPIICSLHAKEDWIGLKKVYLSSLILTFFTTTLSVIGLYIFGEYAYLLWIKNSVEFDNIFFNGMLVVLFFSSLWGISSVIPLATNTHFKFTVVFLFSQITAFILCYFGLVVCNTSCITNFGVLLISIFNL